MAFTAQHANRQEICISDEVQTGFGRLGDVFWGFEEHNVVPDMVVIGKPMGNGHPMGAVITNEEISNSFEMGVQNPVSCAIGKSVLEVIESFFCGNSTSPFSKH